MFMPIQAGEESLGGSKREGERGLEGGLALAGQPAQGEGDFSGIRGYK